VADSEHAGAHDRTDPSELTDGEHQATESPCDRDDGPGEGEMAVIGRPHHTTDAVADAVPEERTGRDDRREHRQIDSTDPA
jgi:hypothetical protein